MMPPSTEAKLKEILAEILEVDPDRITDSFGPEDAELWDSLNALRLVTAIEQSFEIRLDMAEIAKMASFGAICETVRRHVEA